MTRINPGIATIGFPSPMVNDAKTDTPPAQGIGKAHDKSLSNAGKIPKGSPPPALRKFTEAAKKMSVKKNEQSSPHEPAADSSNTATGAARKPPSRGSHHPALKRFFDQLPQEGVVENAMLSAGSIASTFGVGAALNNIARIHSNPAVKVAGALFPIPAAMASAYVEKGIRKTFDVKSTEFQYSWHSAISPAGLMVTNYAYALSKLPKFPPNTPAGMAATLTVTALGAGIGGGLAETAAHLSKKNASSSDPATSKPGNTPTTFEHGISRASTQIPAVYLNKVIATNAAVTGGTISKGLLLALPATVAVPYVLRNEVASRLTDSVKRQSSGQTSNTDAPRVSGN